MGKNKGETGAKRGETGKTGGEGAKWGYGLGWGATIFIRVGTRWLRDVSLWRKKIGPSTHGLKDKPPKKAAHSRFHPLQCCKRRSLEEDGCVGEAMGTWKRYTPALKGIGGREKRRRSKEEEEVDGRRGGQWKKRRSMEEEEVHAMSSMVSQVVPNHSLQNSHAQCGADADARIQYTFMRMKIRHIYVGERAT